MIKKKNFSHLFKFYLDKRMFKILLLGAISGFPWVLIGSSLSLWLKEEGLSRSTIGWAGLIFTVYAFNYLWAPLVDKIKIPYLTKKIGHRKAWIFSMQIVIFICLIFWSFVEPNQNLVLIIGIGLIVALASATQDITVDALRIEQIGENENETMAAGAAVAVVGWWSGFKLGGVLSLNIAQYLENIGFQNYWQLTFIFLSLVIIFFNICLLFIKEKQRTNFKKIDDNNKNIFSKATNWVASTIFNPITSFFKKNGFSIALGIVGFIFLFKIGEAFLGRMSVIFYKEICFSKYDIALY